MQPVLLHFRLSEGQFISACNALWAHRAIGPVGNIIGGTFVTVIGAFMLWQAVPGVFPWIVSLIGLIVLCLNFARDRVWRHYYRLSAKYSDVIAVSFSQSGLRVTSAEGHNQLVWSEFSSYVVNDRYFYLIVDQRNFSIIPQDQFENPTDRAAAERLITKNVKPLTRRYV